MNRKIVQMSLLVRDYDEAIEFYRDKLGFVLLEDTRLSDTKRWVRVAPKGSPCSLLLARAATEEQLGAVGNQTGGRVFLFMHTDDLRRDVAAMRAQGVHIEGEPRCEEYGLVVIFTDLYGNKWDLIQPAAPA
jgi:catechol 2,3-dioxygenase-like lactoylglutathione lyase family enzyme